MYDYGDHACKPPVEYLESRRHLRDPYYHSPKKKDQDYGSILVHAVCTTAKYYIFLFRRVIL
ncbi:hypothetical protein CENSYa_1081 [Cenarchaeum symbiosum A]|uniref:Uncharacterized protein n=1 Tax=Cenarchaeum symbiosum (strain A) TaxID=414004 RepID=A0RWJ3_CENSY|nr:hypothetical protein CENSYa_1081 [Cenarchaeum symbiosum A]